MQKMKTERGSSILSKAFGLSWRRPPWLYAVTASRTGASIIHNLPPSPLAPNLTTTSTIITPIKKVIVSRGTPPPAAALPAPPSRLLFFQKLFTTSPVPRASASSH